MKKSNYKKLLGIILLTMAACCIGCGSKEEKKSDVIQEESAEPVQETKVEIEVEKDVVKEEVSEQRAYFDEDTEWYFYADFLDKDYDRDGKTDRVYQNSDAVYIEFGDGSTLQICERAVEKEYESITVTNANLSDADKDEIVVLSELAPYSTGFRCYGKLKIYAWNGSNYVEQKIPFENGTIKVQYQTVGAETICASVIGTDYKFDIDVNNHWLSVEEYIEWYDNTEKECETWTVYFEQSADCEQIVCLVNMLEHQDVDTLGIKLKYENGEFKLDEIKYIRDYYESEYWNES